MPTKKSTNDLTPSKDQSKYKIGIGDKAPAFARPATGGTDISLKSLKGQSVILYFYPKDNTSGCTLEGQDFKRLEKSFRKLDCTILGVSRDTISSHERFKEKCGFPFALLSDEDESLCRAFDVIQMKSLYGRKFEGIERSTFLIDAKGVIRGAWRKVKVPGHAEAVLEFAKQNL